MKQDKASELVTKARAGLVVDAPFWASILLKLPMRADPDGVITTTMATNGEEIVYYPKDVESLSLFKIKGELAHETAHVIFLHPYRRGNRDPRLWNIACDMAINPMILEAGFELPEDSLNDARFKGMEAEAIYAILEKEQPGEKGDKGQKGQQQGQQGAGSGQGGQGQGKPQPGKGKGKPQPGKGQGRGEQGGQVPDPGGNGGVFDAPAQTPAEMKAKEEERKIDIEQAINVAKRQGRLPGALERRIEKLLKPVIDWREKLAQFVDTSSRNDYSWTMPNRRFTHLGYYLPQLHSPELGHVVVLVDASGSVSKPELEELVTEARAITEIYEGATLSVIFFDTKASEVFEITNDTDVTTLKVPKMGGGTDYRPGFAKIDKAGLTTVCIVVLTDGCCNSFPKDAQAPVLWVLNQDNERFRAPFGETVIMPQRMREEE